jgi:hypothetical protein
VATGLVLGLGAIWFIAGSLWFDRRIRALREHEHLTTRDRIAIEYPPWARRLAKGYIALATTTGLLILLAVVVTLIALATK